MKYRAKSVIIGRMKRDEKAKAKDDMFRPCFIAMYDHNDPHLKAKSPRQILEFKKIHKINLENFRVNYLLAGNDLVVNNLEYLEVIRRRDELFLNGRQKISILRRLFL